MQAEKYIYYLTKGGLEVEKDINNQFSSNKPQDYSFKVINQLIIDSIMLIV